MSGSIAKVVCCAFALVVAATAAQAQTIRHKREQRAPATPAIPAPSMDARDSVVAVPGPFSGRPYWLALAQCGGTYFKLNTLYTDAAVHARVVTPNPTANTEFTKKLNEAIKTATTYLDGAERFLMTERGIERDDAVMTYDGQMRAAAERSKAIEAALAAAKACPALYQACQETHPKQCSEPLGSTR
jgi:hypothetical protein